MEKAKKQKSLAVTTKVKTQDDEAYKFGFKRLLNRKKISAPTIETLRAVFAKSKFYNPTNKEENEFLFSKMIQGINRTIVTKLDKSWVITGTFDEKEVLTDENKNIQLLPAIRFGLIANPQDKPIELKQNEVSIPQQIALNDSSVSTSDDASKKKPLKVLKGIQKAKFTSYGQTYVGFDAFMHAKGYYTANPHDLIEETEDFNLMLRNRFLQVCISYGCNSSEYSRLYKIFIEGFRCKCLKWKYKYLPKKGMHLIKDDFNFQPIVMAQNEMSRLDKTQEKNIAPPIPNNCLTNNSNEINELNDPNEIEQVSKVVLDESNGAEKSNEILAISREKPDTVIQVESIDTERKTLLFQKFEAYKEGVRFADLNREFKLDDDSLNALIGDDLKDSTRQAFLVGYKKRILDANAPDVSNEGDLSRKKSKLSRLI